MMDGNDKRGCPHKEWVDDIIGRKSARSSVIYHNGNGNIR